MSTTDATLRDVAGASRALVVAVRPTGVVIPPYDGLDEVPLDLSDLRAIEELAGSPPSSDLSPALLERLEERGLLAAEPRPEGATAALSEELRTGARPSTLEGQFVLPTPVLVGCAQGGFEFVDHEGVVRARLSALELLAVASFRLPTTVDEAAALHRDEAGDAALELDAFRHLTGALVAVGLLARFDPEDPEHSRRTRQAEQMRDGMRRQAQVHEEFDRLEAEQDLHGGPADRVPVVGFHTSFSGLPAALGMLIAAARGHEGGALEESYDFRPRLLWDRPRLERAATQPGIYLFSNYIWSSPVNLAHSALVKQLDARHVTIHGGPDTPKYPEDTERFFAEHPHVDVTVHGEGEATFVHLLEALRGHVGDGPPDLAVLADVPGLSFRDGDRVVRSDPRDRVAELDTIPSPVLMGLYDGFIPAGGGPGGLNLETNRGCPYGCTFCDWGSATLSRIRKFDLDRVFAELEWCAKHGFKVVLCDANFGIFERDVAIAEKIAELKETYGFPRFVGTNYAKNTVKHLARIIEIFTEVGIVAEGKLSMQTFDTDTLMTIRRKNIKTEKYDDLSVEFRRNLLPLSVDIMMGLPGATPEAFRNDLQACIDRDIRSIVHTTVLLANSPMNDPVYRAENGIVARPGEEVRESATYTRDEWAEMYRLRMAFWLFENFGILRQVATFVRSQTGRREIDFYEQLVEDVHGDPERWPELAITLKVLPDLMLPPVTWRRFVDEVRTYLVGPVGLTPGAPLETVLAVQHALLPARDRAFPVSVDLPHDYASWHAAMANLRDEGHLADWHERLAPLEDYGPATFTVDDPLDSCQRAMGPTYAFLSEDSAWDLSSPVSRPRQADVTTRKVST